MTEGVPTIDPEQCPSQIEHSFLIEDTVHQESQEDQSLNVVRIDDSYGPFVEIPSDHKTDVDEIVDPIQASSDDESKSQEIS